MTLTDAKVRSLKAKKNRYEVWETGRSGFGLRVSASSNKSWFYFYRFEGKNRRMTLGVYPEMTLEKARFAHTKAREQLIKKIDPNELLIQSNIEHRGSPTVSQMVNEYVEKWAKPRKRTWKEDARMLFKDVIPLFGKRKAKDIKRRDIVLLMDAIVERGSPITANRTLRVIKKMFSFTVKRGVLDASPCMEIDPPAKENQRERVLNEEEIKMFWLGLDKAKMSDATRLVLRLLLITAQRKGEVSQAEWSEVDLKNGWWTIPKERSKNEQIHRVPLSPMAIDIFQQAKVHLGESKWVFPSTKGQPITPRSISRAIRNNSEKISSDSPKHKHPYGDVFNIAHFTPHDLRRTATSMMISLGISEFDVSKVLNHTLQSVTNKHYNHYSYDKEKQKALGVWERKLKTIIIGKSSGKAILLKR
jgi:integrase